MILGYALIAMLISAFISAPFLGVAKASGAFEKTVPQIIESAKAAGRYTRARLIDYSQEDSSKKYFMRYLYEVNGVKYEYSCSTENYGIDELITVYWEKGKPGHAYVEGQEDVHFSMTWIKFLPVIFFLIIFWLMYTVLGLERLI